MASPNALSRPVVLAPAAPPIRLEVRPATALRIAVLVMFVANLGRIPVFSTGDHEAPILINDLAVMFAVGVCGLATLQARSLRLDRTSLAGLLFAVIGAGSALAAMPRFGLTGFAMFVSLSYLARWLVYFAIYIAVINVVRLADVERVWSAYDWMITAFAGFGVFQSAFLPGFAQLVYPTSRDYIDWDVQGHRLVSTVLEPNIAGAMLMIAFLVDLSRLVCGARVPRWRLLLVLVALVCTLSRSAAVGLVAGVAVIVLVRGLSKRMLLFGGAVSAVTLALLPKIIAFAAAYGKFSVGSGTSAAARFVGWARAIAVIRDHPVIGVGFNTVAYILENYGGTRLGAASYAMDGGLLFVAVMTGFVGLAVYLYMLWTIGRRSIRVWRRSNLTASQRALMLGAASSIVAICVDSVFVNSLFTTLVMEPLWVLWGLAFVIARDTAT